GAVVTPLLVLSMVGPHGEGWRKLFMLVGAAGSIWVVMWLMGTRGSRADEMSKRAGEHSLPMAEEPFSGLFAMRTFWITLVVGVAVNISWHFYRVWLPRHSVVDLRFSDRQLQYIIIAFYLTADLGSIAIGFLTRKLISNNRPIERARKIVFFLAAL